ncbi:MAG: UvrD-helicase domain-containing protein, partial [Acidimicrobiales bacterium]
MSVPARDRGASAGAGPRPFRLSDDLPAGVTLLEASAGTGKTYTIAALAARYLAEGVPIERLLVVTFTRSATGELRSRVRARLVSAEAGLRAASEGRPTADDELLRLLFEGDAEQVSRRRRALGDALADFDAATIATIHGFCEQVLGGLGTAADCGRDRHFVEDHDALVDEVVDDLYLRKYLNADGAPPFGRKEARSIVATAVANRDARLDPSAA